MYIAVCDDQAEELSALTALLDQWQAERHFPLRYHTFRSAAGMLDVAQSERFSLYLLDVMMPGIDGMDAAREIRTFDDAADIVFLTSSPGFAYESYGVRALEYLLKPISGGLLFPVLDKLMLREQRPQDGLTLKAGATLVRVPFSRLSYVEVTESSLLPPGRRHGAGGGGFSEGLPSRCCWCRPEFMQHPPVLHCKQAPDR